MSRFSAARRGGLCPAKPFGNYQHYSDCDMDLIRQARDILCAGGLVAFPTETVYGLGADATNAAAVSKIFSAKGRPSTNPLIVHVASAHVAQRYAREWPDSATALAARFWPGPLTLVLPKAAAIVANGRFA